jgi:hypothetical protein
MGELQGVVGADWVRTYDGALTREVLREALAWAERSTGRPNLDRLDWTAIARQTLELYRTVVRGPAGGRGG